SVVYACWQVATRHGGSRTVRNQARGTTPHFRNGRRKPLRGLPDAARKSRPSTSRTSSRRRKPLRGLPDAASLKPMGNARRPNRLQGTLTYRYFLQRYGVATVNAAAERAARQMRQSTLAGMEDSCQVPVPVRQI